MPFHHALPHQFYLFRIYKVVWWGWQRNGWNYNILENPSEQNFYLCLLIRHINTTALATLRFGGEKAVYETNKQKYRRKRLSEM